MADETRTCIDCGSEKPEEEMLPGKNRCRECKRKYDRERCRGLSSLEHAQKYPCVPIDWKPCAVPAPQCAGFAAFPATGAGLAVLPDEDHATLALTFEQLARFYGTTENNITRAVARADESGAGSSAGITPYLARLAPPMGRVRTYVVGPGIFHVGMRLDPNNSRAFVVQDWLAKRGWELVTNGVTTANGPGRSPWPSTAASHGSLLRTFSAALAEVADELDRVKVKDEEQDGRLDGHDGVIGDLVGKINEERAARARAEAEQVDLRRAYERIERELIRRKLPQRYQRLLMEWWAQNGCCVCGCRDRRSFHICHIVSVKDGGATAIDNLFPGCEGCNFNRTEEDRRLRSSAQASYPRDPRPAWMRERAARLAEKDRLHEESVAQRDAEILGQDHIRFDSPGSPCERN